ncbi:MAG: nucleoside monophosphate kinase [Terrimicrobiaceae bacterium]|nr:nucleoside monophosphate kinase [Terrimicrobiaceae bacterium]
MVDSVPFESLHGVIMQRYRTYLIFGAPGSGKGTQGKSLGTIPRFFHCACGEVFRSIDTRTALGRKFVEYSSRGELVPDEVTVELWRVRIEHCEEAHAFKPDIDHLVLDGIPRNLAQAKIMDDIINVQRVFHLSCPDRSKLIERLRKRAIKENRLDDANETVIRHRLEAYEKESKPMLDFYRPEIVCHIDASQPPVVVFSKIVALVAQDAAAESAVELPG